MTALFQGPPGDRGVEIGDLNGYDDPAVIGIHGADTTHVDDDDTGELRMS